MDNKNWKSITVSIDNYHAVRGISMMKNRKLSGTIIKLIGEHCKGNGYLIIRELVGIVQTDTCFWCKGEGHTETVYEWEKEEEQKLA